MSAFIDYDFIEIGTSNFDTCIESATDTTIGISIDAVKYYIDQLPEKPNVKKLHLGISDKFASLDVFYIPENIIIEKQLAPWLKGCNCLNKFHPLHRNLEHYVVKETVQVIPISELLITNNVRGIKLLKIDTEGHDCIILNCLYDYLKTKDKMFYPKTIIFESNANTPPNVVTATIAKFQMLGYTLISRGHDDTYLEYRH